MLLFKKQQNGSKATKAKAENVTDDHYGSRVLVSLKMESENDWPHIRGLHC